MSTFLILLLSSIWMLAVALAYNAWLDRGGHTITRHIVAGTITGILLLIPIALVLYFV